MRRSLRILCVFTIGLVSASVAWAAPPRSKEKSAQAVHVVKGGGETPAGFASGKGQPEPDAPEAYGTSLPTRISLLSYNFQGQDPFGDDIADDGFTYRRFVSATDSLGFSGNVSIPAGASITKIGFDNCDNTAAGAMTMQLLDHSGDHTFTNVASVASTNASVCGFNEFTLATPYDHNSNVDHVFEIFIQQGVVDLTLKFRSAYVEYKRRVSPAPAVPSFGDVPTSDIGYQYVEALLASGITGGTAPGVYSPNNPVTRRQMAIFIVKALGLNWAN